MQALSSDDLFSASFENQSQLPIFKRYLIPASIYLRYSAFRGEGERQPLISAEKSLSALIGA